MGILIRGADSTYRVENCFIPEKSFLVPTKHNENLSPITFFKVIVCFFFTIYRKLFTRSFLKILNENVNHFHADTFR